MNTRLLPREEWPRLSGTELETVYPVLPAGAQIVVVEDGDQIVGTWAVYPQITVHGCWVAPSHRGKAVVFRHLLRGMQNTALAMGATAVQTGSMSEDVTGMLGKLGAVELPGRHFVLGLGVRPRTEAVAV